MIPEPVALCRCPLCGSLLVPDQIETGPLLWVRNYHCVGCAAGVESGVWVHPVEGRETMNGENV